MWRVLRKDKNLCIYLLGKFISNLGNHFSFFAQSIATYMFTNTLSSVGLLWIIRGVASLLTIPIGGIAADLYNRKKIILFTDTASAATSFCFIFLNSSNYIWLLLILSFISQTINRFFDPAAKASFKQISPQTPPTAKEDWYVTHQSSLLISFYHTHDKHMYMDFSHLLRLVLQIFLPTHCSLFLGKTCHLQIPLRFV